MHWQFRQRQSVLPDECLKPILQPSTFRSMHAWFGLVNGFLFISILKSRSSQTFAILIYSVWMLHCEIQISCTSLQSSIGWMLTWIKCLPKGVKTLLIALDELFWIQVQRNRQDYSSTYTLSLQKGVRAGKGRALVLVPLRAAHNSWITVCTGGNCSLLAPPPASPGARRKKGKSCDWHHPLLSV